MTTVEAITEKIQKLPISSQKEVADFVDDLIERSAKTDSSERATAWENWANSHTGNAVVLDDSREAIYEN